MQVRIRSSAVSGCQFIPPRFVTEDEGCALKFFVGVVSQWWVDYEISRYGGGGFTNILSTRIP